MEMRVAFVTKLMEMMESDERICLLDADLAKANGTIKVRQKFPERAFDVGIAEQNMASVAAGMASYGMIPFISTFTPFATRRILDQIAVSIAYARMNVKILGTDPGICAELNGGTHMSLEDIGALRSIPTMTIFEPVDEVQITQALPQIVEHNGPVYIRMFRKQAPKFFADDYKFDLYKADVVREGKDITLFASGIMLPAAAEAAETLAGEGVSAEVVNVHTLKPLDEETVLKSLRKTGRAVTCENHNIIGGLFSDIAELAAQKFPCRIAPIGTRDQFGQVGKVPDLARVYHMTPEDIVAAAKSVL